MARVKATAAKSKPLDGSGSASSGCGGSASTSRAPSPSTSSCSKSIVGTYALDGVAIDWDNEHVIRERIRNNQNLLRAIDPVTKSVSDCYVDGTKENVIINLEVLLPLASLMGSNGLSLPSIENLIFTCEQFFKVAKVSRNADHAYQQAWGLRRLLGKLKSFCYREAAPQDRGLSSSSVCMLASCKKPIYRSMQATCIYRCNIACKHES